MADAPVPQIAISGSNTLVATNMTKSSTTVYTYPYTVGAGNGTATIAMSTGTDVATNVVTSAPTSGADFTVDNTAPAGGSITYTNGYFTISSVPITYTTGTDGGSGLNTATGKIQRAEATLTSGTCGAYSAFSDLITEFDGSYTDTTVVSGNCYKYQYLIQDAVTNQAIYTSANEAKVEAATPDIVAIDAGASLSDRTSLTSNTWFKYTSTGSDDQVSFSWTDPSSVSDDTFYYEINADSGNTITGDESTTANPYIDSITVSEGTNYFHVRPKNGTGTWGTERTFIIKYDKTNPTVSAGSDQTKNSVFTQDATTSDLGSGIASYLWEKQSGTGTITFGTATTEDTTISSDTDGTFVIKLTVTDNAGNVNTDDFTLVWNTVGPAVPSATPTGGTYTSAQSVTLSSAGSSQIFYTLNGDTPTTGSSLYAGAISINTSLTLKALAVDTEANESGLMNETYVINPTSDNAAPIAGIPFEISQATDGTGYIDITLSNST
jgi:hypothetical protein